MEFTAARGSPSLAPMLINPSFACGVSRSIMGQPWRWRGAEGEGDSGYQPDALIDQLLLARGVARDDLERHRQPTLRGFMPDPSVFRDMEKAAARLADALEAGEAVTIFGDYDVDGATSAALLVRLLRQLGGTPQAYIPDRLMEGYGPSGEALVRIADGGARLIVTVDCGAQAFEALDMARAAGVDVIVVDHHKCATRLPDGFAIVNPNRLDESERRGAGILAAVGVAFLLGAALLRTLRGRGFFAGREEPKLIELLDLVALGTVADVAQLKGLNRAFVTQGLKVMAQRRNIGLAALADAARLTRAPTSTDLGFALGPRINAGGRVGKSDLGVRLLTTEDPAEAEAIAAELDRLNEERRAIEIAVCDAAEALTGAQGNRAVAVVAAPGWHPGVIGIVAGRLKEKLQSPPSSSRSRRRHRQGVGTLDLRCRSRRCGAGGEGRRPARRRRRPRHGGGASPLRPARSRRSPTLDARLAADVARSRDDRALLLDAVLAPRGVSPDLCDALDAGGPYGAGWPSPRVATGPVSIVKADVVGNGHLRLVVAGDDGRRIKAIAFRMADSALGEAMLAAPAHRKIWLAGRMKRDEYNGNVSAEILLDDAAWAD
jgi:single-stranded-DNA-specific exonuclease